MTLVNPGLGPVLVQVGGGQMGGGGGKDSRWLTLEVCREFARSKCSRSDEECKYAHPPSHVEIQNGRVTCCFDSIKGKCQRKDPPCKYLHPPQHLREILLHNGRQNLILKNFQIQPNVATGLPTVLPMHGGLYHPLMYDTSGTATVAAGNISAMKSAVQAAAGSYQSLVVPGQYYNYTMTAGAGSIPNYILPTGPSPQTALAYNPYFMSPLNGYGAPQALMPPVTCGAVLDPGSSTLGGGLVLHNSAVNGVQSAGSGYVENPTVTATVGSQMTTSTAATSNVGGGEINPGGLQVSLGGGVTWEDMGGSGGVVSLAGQNTLVSVDSGSTFSSYNQPVYYKRQVVEVMAGGGGVVNRKRAHDPTDDLYLGVSSMPGGLIPVMKRPALVDAKSGIPVYQSVSNGQAVYQSVSNGQQAAAYQQLAALQQQQLQQLQQQQLLSYAIPGPAQVIPRF